MGESTRNLQGIIWHQHVKAFRAQGKGEQNKYKEGHSANRRRHVGTLTGSNKARAIVNRLTSNLR